LNCTLQAQRTDRDLIIIYDAAMVTSWRRWRRFSLKKGLNALYHGRFSFGQFDQKGGCSPSEKEHPGLRLLTYFNSSAEVKTISDEICTSANTLKIVESN
jgi:hypothetical protein